MPERDSYKYFFCFVTDKETHEIMQLYINIIFPYTEAKIKIYAKKSRTSFLDANYSKSLYGY